MNKYRIETVESKYCKYNCGKTLFWSKENRWYSDNVDGKIRHTCTGKPSSKSNVEDKIDLLNKNLLHNTSLVNEMRMKLDAVLNERGYVK